MWTPRNLKLVTLFALRNGGIARADPEQRSMPTEFLTECFHHFYDVWHYSLTALLLSHRLILTKYQSLSKNI
ncbi:hypothetical protein PHYPO_G00016280 [Pangasianodon hypophthalmus]|uniref:Uncharacterized protein n=1 Tax=Pangasianodon hypophthalmus TaxID=310915 RepID=A0A5N5N4I3_PANHP|nr:hypothetical protein PHYPO_G00016280 [Pangasianodon hypophthalmus]